MNGPERKSRCRRRAIVYGGLYLIALPLMIFGGCADRLILIPQTGAVSTAGLERRVLPFEDGELELWTARGYLAEESPSGFVLAFTGNADRGETAALVESYLWRDHPVEVWGMNYPGYGQSTGPARLARLGPAGLAAYDELRRVAGDRPVFIAGTSLGTTVALHVAARREVDGLVLHNPPPLRQLILGRFGWWNLWLLAGPISLGVPGELDSLENAAATTAPGVFVLADADEIVPPKYQRRVAQAYAGPARMLETVGGHNDPLTAEGDAALREHLAWLWSQAGPEPRTLDTGQMDE